MLELYVLLYSLVLFGFFNFLFFFINLLLTIRVPFSITALSSSKHSVKNPSPRPCVYRYRPPFDYTSPETNTTCYFLMCFCLAPGLSRSFLHSVHANTSIFRVAGGGTALLVCIPPDFSVASFAVDERFEKCARFIYGCLVTHCHWRQFHRSHTSTHHCLMYFFGAVGS